MSLARRKLLTAQSEDADNWETIIDWTAEETMQCKTFTVDDNGEPFELKMVSIFVAVAPPEDSSITNKMELRASIFNSVTKYWIKLGTSPKYGEKNHYAHVLLIPMDYGLYPIIQEWSFNDTSMNDMLTPADRQLFPGINRVDSDETIIQVPKTCTVISIGSHFQTNLFKGSKVIIKGIRV